MEIKILATVAMNEAMCFHEFTFIVPENFDKYDENIQKERLKRDITQRYSVNDKDISFLKEWEVEDIKSKIECEHLKIDYQSSAEMRSGDMFCCMCGTVGSEKELARPSGRVIKEFKNFEEIII